MFFLRRLRPLEVVGERVRTLRVSLNTPVLSTPDLPVGPARAVIVVHKEARGRMDATVGVRAQRGGEVAYWSFDGELTSADDLDVASDAALTFAESLGFLFDDEALGPGSDATKAFRAWLRGDGIADAREPATDDDAFGAAANDMLGSASESELMLEELMVEEPIAAAPRTAMQTSLAPPPQPAPRELTAPKKAPPSLASPPTRAPEPIPSPAPPAPVRPAPARLSKFRAQGDATSAAKGASASRSASARQPLARVQLVKRRGAPEEERKLLLRKLLTSF